jgi:hypothetical protein
VKVFTEPLPSIEHLLWLHYSGLQASYHIMNILAPKIGVFQVVPRKQNGDFLEDGLLAKSKDYDLLDCNEVSAEFYQTSRRYNPEDSHRCENLKSRF